MGMLRYTTGARSVRTSGGDPCCLASSFAKASEDKSPFTKATEDKSEATPQGTISYINGDNIKSISLMPIKGAITPPTP